MVFGVNLILSSFEDLLSATILDVELSCTLAAGKIYCWMLTIEMPLVIMFSEQYISEYALKLIVFSYCEENGVRNFVILMSTTSV